MKEFIFYVAVYAIGLLIIAPLMIFLFIKLLTWTIYLLDLML